MKDSIDPVKRICTNEISLHNHVYIILMCINHNEQSSIDIQIESKENGDQWKSTFNVNDIETITTKTGNFKSFNVFINMLENAINQKSSSVSIDLLTYDDFQLLRQNEENSKQISTTKSSTKRYLMLIYSVEYDLIYYPLSLRYYGKSDSINLIEQIHQLTTENHILKTQLQSDNEQLNLQQECLRLKKENDDYRQQLLLYNNTKEKDEHIEYLRQMIRQSEDALIKERVNLQKTKIKKSDHYKLFMNQIQSLKTSERQLKLKVKNLNNQIDLIRTNYSLNNSQRQSTSLTHTISDKQHSYHSEKPSTVIYYLNISFFFYLDFHVRFNPTAYINGRKHKFQQIELEKKKETQQRLNSGRRHSDSDISNTSSKSNHILPSSNLSRKRTNKVKQDKTKSDIEQTSSPPILHKASSNNSTIIYSNDNQQNFNSTSIENMNDIDKRLISLEKFFKKNVL